MRQVARTFQVTRCETSFLACFCCWSISRPPSRANTMREPPQRSEASEKPGPIGRHKAELKPPTFCCFGHVTATCEPDVVKRELRNQDCLGLLYTTLRRGSSQRVTQTLCRTFVPPYPSFSVPSAFSVYAKAELTTRTARKYACVNCLRCGTGLSSTLTSIP